MKTLVIKAFSKAEANLPVSGKSNVKLLKQGNGSGVIDLRLTLPSYTTPNPPESDRIISIVGGSFIMGGQDVDSYVYTGSSVENISVRVDDEEAYIHIPPIALYLLRERNLQDQDGDTPIVDYSTPFFGNLYGTSSMFSGKTDFNRSVRGIVSLTALSSSGSAANMFQNCNMFNKPVSHFDLSGVSSISTMFQNCYSFNQAVPWDTSGVEKFNHMFNGCRVFNQSVNHLNTSNATEMQSMFNGAYAFNHPLDEWDVSGVTNMSAMFDNARAFDQDLSSWDFNLEVNLASFLNISGMSPENYSKLLIKLASIDWSGRSQTKVLGASGVRYNASGAAARQELVDDGWTITDGGQV